MSSQEVRVRLGRGRDKVVVELWPDAQRAVDAWEAARHSSSEQKSTSEGEEGLTFLLDDLIAELRYAKRTVEEAPINWDYAKPISDRLESASSVANKALGKHLAESAMAETAAECERDEGECERDEDWLAGIGCVSLEQFGDCMGPGWRVGRISTSGTT